MTYILFMMKAGFLNQRFNSNCEILHTTVYFFHSEISSTDQESRY